MRKLPRDLVLILRTEAKNQRTPPIDYVIAEDGGRMVHRPEPDIAMAELLEEAATALASERAAHAETKRERDEALKALEQIAAIEPVSNCDAGSMARSRMRDIARYSIARRPK